MVSEDESREFALPRRTLQILAYVILNRRRPLARDTVAFDLFPDEDEERARASLRRNLSYLLGSLPDGKRFFDVASERIAWSLQAPARVDVIAFEEAVRDGRDADALAEYAGQLLPTLYDEWTVPERERLRDLYHEALVRSIGRERSARNFDAATAYAHRLLEDDPWREDVLRLLMTIRHETGDRAGALAAFERFAQRLRDELGADPMPETAALRDAVLRGIRLPSSEPPRAAHAASVSEPGLSFVGRDAPMQTARTVWHAAGDGRPSVLFVEGEAGSGKSRFVTELARLIESEGGIVVRGYSSSGGEHRPYESFVDALRDTPGLLDEHAGAVITDDRAARLRLFESVRRRLRELSHARPLAVVLEDAHWAGSATIDLVEFIASRLERSPVLLVITVRSDEIARAHPLRALRRQLASRGATQLTLGRLSDREATAAMRAALPERVPDAEIARAVAWAAGLPLMLAEAARDVAAGRELRVPDIDELVGERFARLSGNAETALIFGAVAGERFDLATLAAATGWRDDEVVDAVGESIQNGLLRAVSRAPGLSFAFTHDLVRAAALARIPDADRRRAHGLLARALASDAASAGSRAAEIARHFSHAGETIRAAEYWAQAAQHALDVFANAEAREAATAGLAALGSNDPGHRRLRYDLFSLREVAATRLGALDDRRADARAMVTAAEGDERKVRALQALFEAYRDQAAERSAVLRELAALAPVSPLAGGTYHLACARDAFLTAEYDRAREAAVKAAQAFDLAGDVRGAMNARFFEISVLGRMGRFDAAAEATAALQPAVDEAEDLSLRVEFHRVAASAADDSDRQIVIDHSRRALDLALRLGDRYAEGRARQNVAWGAGKTGDYETAIAENERALTAFRDVGDATGIRESTLNSAATRLFCGDARGAQVLLDTLAHVEPESPWISLRASLLRGSIALRMERYGEAKRLVEAAMETARTLGTALSVARCDLVLANVAVSDERDGDALVHIERALEAFTPLGQPALSAEAYAMRARLYARRKDVAEARAAAQAAESLVANNVAQSYSEIAWNLGEACEALGDRDAAFARACASIAAAVRDALHMPADLAESYLALPWHVAASAYLNEHLLFER